MVEKRLTLTRSSWAGSIGKVPAAAQPQGLVDRLLEAKVGLFDIAILVRFARIVSGGLHVIVVHQGLIALGVVAFAATLDLHDSRREIVGTMLLGHTAELPEAGLQPFGQRLEAFGEAQVNSFDI